MKVLTAANLDNHSGDFSFTEVGEIVVRNHLVCDNGPSCGCERAAIGMTTRRGTATMRVTEKALSDHDVTTLIRGYIGGAEQLLTEADARHLFNEAAAVAAQFPVGTVLRVQVDGEHMVYTADTETPKET